MSDQFAKVLKIENPFSAPVIVLIAIVLIGSVYLLFIRNTSNVVVGTVEKISMDTAQYYQMSNVIVHIRLPSGEKASVPLPVGITAKAGDKVRIIESEYVLTKGKKHIYAGPE